MHHVQLDQLMQVKRKVERMPDVESSSESVESPGSEEQDEDDFGLPD